jgi:hypothetical protein
MQSLTIQEIDEVSGGGVLGIADGDALVGWWRAPRKIVLPVQNLPQPIIPLALAM